jgi:hypothetical protein
MCLYSIGGGRKKKLSDIYRTMDLKGISSERTQKSFAHRPTENQGSALRDTNCELSNWPFQGAA